MTFPLINVNFTLLIGGWNCGWGWDCGWGCGFCCGSDSDDDSDSDSDSDSDDDSSFFKTSLQIEFVILYCLYDNVICSL